MQHLLPNANTALLPRVTFVSTARDDHEDTIEVKASHHMYNACDNFWALEFSHVSGSFNLSVILRKIICQNGLSTVEFFLSLVLD